MELKHGRNSAKMTLRGSSNRTFMELKHATLASSFTDPSSNRTFMELKLAKSSL